MAQPARRRTRMAVVSFMMMLLLTAKRAEHHPGQGNGGSESNGIVSTLNAVPELISELGQLLVALTKP
jgi:hypothetical protein